MELSAEQNMALSAKQALLQAEAALSAGKQTLGEDELRAAKEALRLQRQTYREQYRSIVMALEPAGVVVTVDTITVPSG